MEKTIEIVETCAIRRPIGEVRSQFADIEYHATHPVHDGVTFTVLGNDEGVCRYRQSIKVLGMDQIDEAEIYTTEDGCVVSDTVAGTNPGAQFFFRFNFKEPELTEVIATLTVPLKGARAWTAPAFAMAARQALKKAAEEDKRDLEAGNYARYRRHKAGTPT